MDAIAIASRRSEEKRRPHTDKNSGDAAARAVYQVSLS